MSLARWDRAKNGAGERRKQFEAAGLIVAWLWFGDLHIVLHGSEDGSEEIQYLYNTRNKLSVASGSLIQSPCMRPVSVEVTP